MTSNPELLSYALRRSRREKVEPIETVKAQHWATKDWQLIPRIRLKAPRKPEIINLNEAEQ